MIRILLSARFDFGLINLFQTVLDQRTTISSPPPTPAVSNSRTAVFLFLTFVLALKAGIFFVNVSTRLSRNAYRVPGSAFYFVSSLAFMVGYLFVNASQGVGDEIDVTPIFFSIHAGFRAFQGRFFKIAPPWMSNPQKSKNSKKPLS